MSDTMIYPSLTDFLNELQQNCLLLARHGETDWNAMGLIQGQQDRPLSPKGYQQRKNLFFHLQAVPLVKIYCSSLQRSLQTARPLSVENQIPITTVAELDEATFHAGDGQGAGRLRYGASVLVGDEQICNQSSRSCRIISLPSV